MRPAPEAKSDDGGLLALAPLAPAKLRDAARLAGRIFERKSRTSSMPPERARGGVPEWSNGAVSKTVVRATVPRVRIPPPPPAKSLTLRKCSASFELRAQMDDAVARRHGRPYRGFESFPLRQQVKNKSIKVQEIARELGVVARGGRQCPPPPAGDRLRITAQLVAASTCNHLWAERYMIETCWISSRYKMR